MFTGIIEETGKVIEFERFGNGAKIKIECSKVLDGTKIGDSIAINGCCQTVTSLGSNYFAADVSSETLNITNFPEMKIGTPVNLERALTPTSRMGGHIVQGHIDCKGTFISSEKLSEFYNLTFEVPENMTKYIVKKGSIAINGVSLTVADVNRQLVKVAVIPHTYSNTTLSQLKMNEIVNIETDILGRYVEKFLSSDNNNSRIDENFLKENGFM
ncbi:riboflavin synthase [bacterium]|nr:riboflavin synthase [bacterium]